MVNKFNAVLLLILVVCSILVVTSQHRWRETYTELNKAEKLSKELDEDYGRLLLEQSTWAAHGLIEKAATMRLQMHAPDPHQVQMLNQQGRPLK